MSIKTRKPVPATKAQPVVRKSPEDKVGALIRTATTDAEHRAAVMAAIGLDSLPDQVRDYVREHTALIFTSTADAEGQAENASSKLSEADKALKAAREEARKAETLRQNRTRDRAVFAFRTVRVLRLYKAKDLAVAWGIKEAQISKIVNTGKLAHELKTNDPAKISVLATAASKQSATLRQAMAEPEANVGTVIAALKAENGQLKVKPAAKAAEVEAHEILVKARALLVLLNSNGTTVADIGSVTGRDVVASFGKTFQAYLTRTDKATVAA